MNKLTDFITKRKNDNKHSFIIDNFNNGEISKRISLYLIEQNLIEQELIEQDKIESFSEYSLEDQMAEPWKINDVNINSDSVEPSIVNKNIKKFEQPKQKSKNVNVNHVNHDNHDNHVNHDCYKCKNGGNKNDPFMILNCGHIFHIGCLVEIHFDAFTNCGGIIDEKFINNCICMVCEEPMEVEDILHMHNKFTKSTKEQLKYQTDSINVLDKQLTKLKD